MPRGSKEKYTAKQKRMAEHIADGYEDKGVGEKEAKARAWATVNKDTGGGEKGGSGAKTSEAEKKSRRKSSAKRAVATKNDVEPIQAAKKRRINPHLRELEKQRRKSIRQRKQQAEAHLARLHDFLPVPQKLRGKAETAFPLSRARLTFNN